MKIMISLYVLLMLINLVYGIDTNFEVEITSGIQLQRLPNVVFYQKTQPILFRFQRPPSLINKLNCNALCEVDPQLCFSNKDYSDYFSLIEDKFEFERFKNNEQILADDGEIFDYQFATRNHVPRMFTSGYEVSVLTQRIREQRHTVVYDFNYTSPLERLHPTLSCNHSRLFYLSVLDAMLRFEWTRSFANMCQIKKLQLDIVSMPKLQSVLNKINQEGYVTVVPSLSAYYTLPLVECLISKQTAVIGLHVPLIRRHLQGLQMQKLLTPSFAWSNYTCAVQVDNVNLALVEAESKWIILLPKCDPYTEELCLVTEIYNENSLSVACAHQILQGGSTSKLVSVCPISCRKTGTDTQFVTPLGKYRFLITHPKPDLRVSCSDRTIPLKLNRTLGATVVKVPCECQLEDSRENELSSRYSCGDAEVKLQLYHTIPAAWTKLEDLYIPRWGDTTPRFATLEACINLNWLSDHIQTDNIPLANYFLVPYFVLILGLFLLSYFLYRKTQNQFLNYIPYSKVPTTPQDNILPNNPITIPNHSTVKSQRTLPEIPKSVPTPSNSHVTTSLSRRSTPDDNQYLEPREVFTYEPVVNTKPLRFYNLSSGRLQIQNEAVLAATPSPTEASTSKAPYADYDYVTMTSPQLR